MVDDSKTALAAAAEGKGSIEMAALLLEYGALLNGSGALVLAAEAGRLDLVKFLLERGADIDEIGLEDHADDRETAEMGSALHKAVTEGHVDVVTFLLDHGANINLQDYRGRTPLKRAEERGDETWIRLLEAPVAKV